MQNKVDTHGYIIKGLRGAVKTLRSCIKQKELYFIYYNMETREVTVNEPGGASPVLVCIIESGVYDITQQELADLIVDKIKELS